MKNELRIGNLVIWNYEENSEGNVYPVEYGYELDDIKNNPNIVKPIQLTEEWLERMGFENYSIDCDSEGFNHIDVSFHNKLVTVYLNDYEITFIQYVHQLQNLIHAITGEELTIKE